MPVTLHNPWSPQRLEIRISQNPIRTRGSKPATRCHTTCQQVSGLHSTPKSSEHAISLKLLATSRHLNIRKPQTLLHATAETSVATSNPAMTELLATGTGYCVLIGSIFRSVPQIIRIVKNKSVEGLSLTSFVSELVAYTIIWAYNFNLGYPFSSYGEIVACWIQDIALVGLVLHYRKQINGKVVLATAAFAVFMGVLMTNTCGTQALYVMQASTIAMISLGARIPQIWMNHKRGNSGELSLLTCLMNVCGCFARMFTTIVLTKDTLNLIAAVVQAVLNGVLLYQTLKTFYASRGTVEDPPPQEVGPAKAA